MCGSELFSGTAVSVSGWLHLDDMDMDLWVQALSAPSSDFSTLSCCYPLPSGLEMLSKHVFLFPASFSTYYP